MTSRDHSAHTAAGDDPLCRDRHRGSPVSARGRDFPKVIHSTKGTGGQPPPLPPAETAHTCHPLYPLPRLEQAAPRRVA